MLKTANINPKLYAITALKWMNKRKHRMFYRYSFSNLFSMTTWVIWYQKGKPFWILMRQEMMGWH